jgi:hypothetical protein
MIDAGYNLETYYSNDDHKVAERFVILQKVEQISIEKIDKDTYFNEALYWVNKILAELNEEEKSSAFKSKY